MSISGNVCVLQYSGSHVMNCRYTGNWNLGIKENHQDPHGTMKKLVSRKNKTAQKTSIFMNIS